MTASGRGWGRHRLSQLIRSRCPCQMELGEGYGWFLVMGGLFTQSQPFWVCSQKHCLGRCHQHCRFRGKDLAVVFPPMCTSAFFVIYQVAVVVRTYSRALCSVPRISVSVLFISPLSHTIVIITFPKRIDQ